MIFKGGFEMKTSRTLISSAMLTAMCDTNSIDNLKLLEKFVAMCVAETTDVGSLIDKDKVLKRMDESYSYNLKIEIPRKTVEDFLEWFRNSTPQSQALILNNFISKISDIRVEEPEPELPF